MADPRKLKDQAANAAQRGKYRKAGDIELSFQAAGLFEVFRWVMAWGHHCKVLAPKELKSMVENEVALMKQ